MSGWIRLTAVLSFVALLLGFLTSIAKRTHPETPTYLAVRPSELEYPAVHRAVGWVDRLARDYASVVDSHLTIVEPIGFQQLLSGLAEVAQVIETVEPPPSSTSSSRSNLRSRLEDVRNALAQRRPFAEVNRAARALRTALVVSYELRTSPIGKPNLLLGRRVYLQACMACHGENGAAKTAIAKLLETRPEDFKGQHLQDSLTPYAVFNTVTFGIPGTAMPSFESLTRGQRWDLAFYVLALRQGEIEGTADKVSSEPRLQLSTLANSSDAELQALLERSGVPSEKQKAHLFRLRNDF